jgi:hypothetical protein
MLPMSVFISRKKLQVEVEEAGYAIANLFRTLRAKINSLTLTKSSSAWLQKLCECVVDPFVTYLDARS